VDSARKQELVDRAYQLGFEYERDYTGCAQCVFAALTDTFGKRDAETDAIFQSLTALAGGGAGQGDGSCGGYVGGAAFIGHLLGRSRDNFADPDRIRNKTTKMLDKLHEKLVDEYGTVVCHQIHRKIYGRPFWFKDPEEMIKFEEAGAHETGCTSVVGNATRWTAEIVIEEGLVG
jgi:C_GCAxxG_C_C family probable redox protein